MKLNVIFMLSEICKVSTLILKYLPLYQSGFNGRAAISKLFPSLSEYLHSTQTTDVQIVINIGFY